ncbi:MAG TPA: hypothetical protein VL068_06580 [Microthrixaceae bacterium]|nr:hypothetical protein [Microthrixaceae bacterium]
MTEQGWDHWQNRSGSEALRSLAPEAAVILDQLSRSIALPPDLSRTLRQAAASAYGLAHLGPATPDRAGQKSEASPTPAEVPTIMVRFTEQFVLDVSIIDDASRGQFLAATGDTTFGAIQTIWLADMTPRVRSTLDQIFGISDWDVSEPVLVKDSDLWATIDDFIRVVHNIKGLDPVLSEVVRLRGAREHNCRLCKSLRSRSALLAGADEELFDSIDSDGQPELSERSRTAAAFVDAFIWHPADLSDEFIMELRELFDPAEVVELVLDVMRNAANKIAVALGADAPNVTEGTEIYDIDEEGVAHYGLDAPQQ